MPEFLSEGVVQNEQTKKVLLKLKSKFSYNGSFLERLLTSFIEAKSELLLDRSESLPIMDEIIFAYDVKSKANIELMRKLFDQKLGEVRKERPVNLLDVQKLAEEKKRLDGQEALTLEDLIYSLSHSLASCVNSKKEEGLYPIIESRYIPKNERTSEQKRLDVFNDPIDVHLAFIYKGEGVDSSSLKYEAFDILMLLLVDNYYQFDINNITILAPRKITKIETSYYRSSWTQKLTRDQLEELNTNKIIGTVSKTEQALDQEIKNNIRVVIRPFGSGKTTMLNELKGELKQEGIPEVTFIRGDYPLDRQLEAFNGNVIFVDEAVDIDISSLLERAKKGAIIVLFFPTEEALYKKMPKEKYPSDSYSLIK